MLSSLWQHNLTQHIAVQSCFHPCHSTERSSVASLLFISVTTVLSTEFLMLLSQLLPEFSPLPFRCFLLSPEDLPSPKQWLEVRSALLFVLKWSGYGIILSLSSRILHACDTQTTYVWVSYWHMGPGLVSQTINWTTNCGVVPKNKIHSVNLNR